MRPLANTENKKGIDRDRFPAQKENNALKGLPGRPWVLTGTDIENRIAALAD